MRLLTTLAVLLLASMASMASMASGRATDTRLTSPVGFWQPLDGSGKPLGLIRIFEANGLYYGQIEPSSPHDDRSARCARCTGDRHNQPIIGLILMRHLRPKNGAYVDGDIVDPNTGRIWSCSLRLTDGGRELIMRGFFGISLLGRSQTWRRAEDPRR